MPYMLATTAFILVLRIVMPVQSQANPFYMLASQSMQVRYTYVLYRLRLLFD